MTRFDVVVAGGGPAGASCALKLASYGYSVAIVERGDGKRQHVGESLPSSVRFVLASLELELPEDVVVRRPPSHLVYWGEMTGGAPWTGVPERESSLLVWRGPFDEFLRAAASRGGVRLVEDTVGAVSRSSEGVRVVTAGGDDLTCRLVVDATGRAGILGKMYRRKETAFRTLALTGHFRTGEPSPPTLVEAFSFGWIWSSPLANGLRDVTVMVDPPADRTELFERALGETQHVRALLEGAQASGPVRGIDATPYQAEPFCGLDFFLVGDAGSFLDPLSAHGVHKAMDSALAAAAAIHTLFDRPSSGGDALAFYDERERSIYRVTRERLGALYRQETRFAGQEFWAKRSRGEPEPAGRKPRPPLRNGARLVPSPGVEVLEAPVLEGDYVERREVLVAPGKERPVRFLGTVCLPALYKEIVARGSAADAARSSPHEFARALAAAEWLYREGYLETSEL